MNSAHHNTFEWIFQGNALQSVIVNNNRDIIRHSTNASDTIALRRKESHKMRSWFESGSGIYLVQGKAGAGKSTFMKFLFKHQSTVWHLESGDKSVTFKLLFHSFWRVGSLTQCSLKGFLASILFQIFRDQPELAEACSIGDKEGRSTQQSFYDWFERESRFTKRSLHDWSERELRSSLLAAVAKTSRLLCMFADGIDQAHPDDNVHDLLELLSQLSSAMNCKLFVSSRSLSAVMQRFQHMNMKMTRLQDFTHADICIYIETELATSLKNFSTIDWQEVAQLVNLIADKAEGVFIWVYLVVRDIIYGISQGDDFSMLKQRVTIMPSQIGELYQHILARNPSDTALCAKEHHASSALVNIFLYRCYAWPLPRILRCATRFRTNGRLGTLSSLKPSVATLLGGLMQDVLD